MFNAIIDWFDQHYSPISLASDPRPLAGTGKFMIYFMRQFPAALAVRMITVAISASADAMLPVFVGLVVGPLDTTKPGEMFTRNWPVLLLMLITVAIVRRLCSSSTNSSTTIRSRRVSSAAFAGRATFMSSVRAGPSSRTILPGGSGTKVDAVEVAVSGIVDAVWYAAVFVVVAVVVLAGLDWTLLVPILLWLALYALMFALVMPRIAKQSAVVSEGRSVMTGRIVDSYTNIQTLKTFSSAKHEDKYVSDSVAAHTLQYRGLMREFTYMWSALYLLNTGLVVSIAWMALVRWNHGALSATAVATAVPFALQIMNMSGWLLERGSNIFRQLGNMRDSMETIAQPITLVDAPNAQNLIVREGGIVFDDVTFNYWRGRQGTVML